MDFESFIEYALEEDCPQGDITSESIIPSQQKAKALLLCKQNLVLAGIGQTQRIFKKVDSEIEFKILAEDGKSYKKGDYILEILGKARSLLKAERIALNILQRMCAIASKTKEYVNACKGSQTKILDTRKTTPLMRELEKYAVLQGGAYNHRFSLSDEMMIKDNHLEVLKYDFAKAIDLANTHHPDKKLVIEVTQLGHVKAVLPFADKVTRIMLDNMSNEMIKASLVILQDKIPVEVSGGITLERIPSLCELGVNYISVGALTHTVKAADISMEMQYI
ncbi:MAG TPA: carboxylating nicotinate-nucleotide diphosphorylase [Oligoflexia bacterium]|nr:carboxylating nicotinate-nucleotide diphosphorylase [Oligoflexia bacterium]HMR23958.1 carboxylating nicotinate-nucleotide diphosphorylase [Oligoflexia bacterium]